MMRTKPTMSSMLVHVVTGTTTIPAAQSFGKGAFRGRQQILHQQTTCLLSKLGVYFRKIDRSSRMLTTTSSVYADDNMLEKAEKTNKRILRERGTIAKVTDHEVKQLLGCSMLSRVIDYPRIRFSWKSLTVSSVADIMSRDRFFLLKFHLCCQLDDDVSDDDKKRERLWRIVTFVEMDGLIYDFVIYKGKDTFSNVDLGVSGYSVEKLFKRVPASSTLYIYRWFSSVRLLDELTKKDIFGTSTLIKNRMPKEAHFTNDRDLLKKSRGTSQELLRQDSTPACTK
ncbi:uncharacterized protein LOC115325048 [Ixodes scapularis]|uniref:uncharacterized protein LOC115325048 n=1 Tax=Ixodes scapularis TaxID=6945 RepID=UPI001A9D408A|nr:uncharacterized protein LOC115325048 [Ixodes scapularis]